MPRDAGSQQESSMDLPPDERSPSSSNVIYTRLTANELNDLDLIARQILAVAFSTLYPGNDREQLFIGQRTIAVAKHGGTIYVASNDVYDGAPTIQQQTNVSQQLASDGETGNIVYLANWAGWSGMESRDYHAEIQLVDYFYMMRMPLPQIGVSKPCCSKCKAELDRLGIDYSYWHTQGTGSHYKYPKAQAKWW